METINNTFGTILIVDDKPANLQLLSQILESHGHEVRSAKNGAQALKSTMVEVPDLILLDIRMPDLDGFAVCRKLKENPFTQNIPVIFISAANQINDKVRAFNEGGVDYITKPFQVEEVLARVHTHLSLYRTTKILEHANNELEEWNQLLESRVTERTIELDQAYTNTITGWARALELRDFETEGHSRRVTEMSARLGVALGLENEHLLHLKRGAILHDIGKMGIPDHVLLKPGKLTEEEWATIRLHPVHGYQLLRPIHFLEHSLQVVLHHHERWDGSGYPSKLVGESIPLNARIFSVVDVWDALLHARPYKKPWPLHEVVDYMKDQKEKQFDPNIIDVFLKDVIGV